MDMPEKIWITHEESYWTTFRSFRASDLDHGDEYPSYVRSDLFDQQAKQIESLIMVVQKLQAVVDTHITTKERELGWTGY